MSNRSVTFFTSIFVVCIANFAQSVSIDLNDATGIQSTLSSSDTSATIGIAIRFTGVNQISSYQFKVSFDTTRFAFIGAQQDFGITGEKNILTKNGGSIIGIAQQQLNPPAVDTVEFSYALTGMTTSTLVSGDGLAGVLYLKSKVPLGDSSAIIASGCILADFDRNQTIVNVYNKGTYSVLPVTKNFKDKQNNKNNHEPQSSVSLLLRNNHIRFDLPASVVKNSTIFSFALFTLSGKLLIEYRTPVNNNTYSISGNDNTFFNQSGRYLCCLRVGSRSYSQVISLH